jgi:hypothetical protein
MFFGRCMEMDQLRGFILADNPQGVSVIGERRIGKSSLVWRVYHQVRDSPQVVALWMDSHALDKEIKDDASFYGLISDLAKTELNRKGENRWEGADPLFSGYAEFRDFLKETGAAGFTFCLMIEEFEKLAIKDFVGESFLGNLRHLCDHDEYRFSCVTISWRPLQESQTAEQMGSDFGNNFAQITLGLLEDKPLADLRSYGFKTDGWQLKESELRQVHFLAGAFPFCNQIVLSHVFEAKKFASSIDTAFQKSRGELIRFFRDLWEKRTPQEQRALKALTQGKKVKNPLGDMEFRGIVVKNDSGLDCFSGWLAELIHEQFVLTTKKSRWFSWFPGYGVLMKKMREGAKDTGDLARETTKTLGDTRKVVSEAKKLGKEVLGFSCEEEKTDGGEE